MDLKLLSPRWDMSHVGTGNVKDIILLSLVVATQVLHSGTYLSYGILVATEAATSESSCFPVHYIKEDL